jgi:hypothetical protein
MSPDKLQKLFNLATAGGKVTTGQPEAKPKAVDLSQHRKNLAIQRGIHQDPKKAWGAWMDKTNPNTQDLWNMAEKEYPGTQDEARTAIQDRINSRISNADPSAQEVDLRNQMYSAPDWMQGQMANQLSSVSNRVAQQNTAKAKAIYTKSLEQKMSDFDLTQLDPDVPIEVHLQDIAGLEALNKLDGAQIANGRICVVNDKGEIEPAFSLLGKPDVQNTLNSYSSELDTINSIIDKVVRPMLQQAMETSKLQGSMDNRAAGGAALNALRSGNVPIDQWSDYSPMINADHVDAGIEGIANKSPFMSRDDKLSSAMDIFSRYGNMNVTDATTDSA